MGGASSPASIRATIAYWVRLALLSVLGPATLDDEHDPIVQLKRGHQRERGAGSRPSDRWVDLRRPVDGEAGGHRG